MCTSQTNTKIPLVRLVSRQCQWSTSLAACLSWVNDLWAFVSVDRRCSSCWRTDERVRRETHRPALSLSLSLSLWRDRMASGKGMESVDHGERIIHKAIGDEWVTPLMGAWEGRVICGRHLQQTWWHRWSTDRLSVSSALLRSLPPLIGGMGQITARQKQRLLAN